MQLFHVITIEIPTIVPLMNKYINTLLEDRLFKRLEPYLYLYKNNIMCMELLPGYKSFGVVQLIIIWQDLVSAIHWIGKTSKPYQSILRNLRCSVNCFDSQWVGSFWYMLFCHLLIHAEIYIYMLDTYWRNELIRRKDNDKDAERLIYKNIYLSLYCKGPKRVTQGLHVRGELETEHNWNILTPKLWPSALCLSRSSGLLNRSPGVRSAGCWLSLLQLVYPLSNSTQLSSTVPFCSIRRSYITFKLPRGDIDTPPRLRNFLRYLAIGMRHFRYLWNGLCDRHRAEITVMQFRGHSLPVRQSMRV